MTTNNYSLDVETTGLNAYKNHGMFSVSITDQTGDHCIRSENNRLTDFFLNDAYDRNGQLSLCFLHNAKFDMHFLYNGGYVLPNNPFCTMAMARLVRNNLPSYSLGALLQFLGMTKDDAVKKYMDKHKLYTLETPPGKKRQRKNYHFDQVPTNILVPYNIQDTAGTLALGNHILKRLSTMDKERDQSLPPLRNVMENEAILTKVLFEMERIGVKIDVEYTKKAIEYEEKNHKKAAKDFYGIAGLEFDDSDKCFKEAFSNCGIEPAKTAKGNPCFNKDVLEGLDNDLGRAIVACRRAYKKMGTYYQSYLNLADSNDVIHCNFRQGGTATGRMSCSDPNLQNVHKDFNPDEPFHPRGCFVPREGHNFFMLDYDQMEYRVMLDYAEQMDIIELVNSGVDVHTATADLLNIPRKQAKTVNFMLLYGGGTGKLAQNLGISTEEAADIKANYFSKLPKISEFIKKVTRTAEEKGYVTNWLGRRCYLDSDHSYAAPNYLIQGGCADIVKKAMVELRYHTDNASMLLQIHDEILFEVEHGSEFIIEYLKEDMEKVSPLKHLPLTVGVDFSNKNWADKIPYEL